MNRFSKIILKVLSGFLILTLIVVGVGWWRLEQGPLRLGFLRGIVEDVVSSSLENAQLSIQDAVIVRDEENDAVSFRLQGLKIEDDKGNFVGRAPSAEVGLNFSQLLTGSVKLTSLTLIGPRFTLHRSMDGGIKLGFEEESSAKSSGPSGRTAKTKSSPSAEQIIQSTKDADDKDVLSTIISSLTNQDEEESATSKLNNITIRNARISLYDEALDSVFFIPNSSMVFRRGSKGLVLLANGQVAGGDTPGRMKLEVIFNEKSGLVDVLAIVSDLVPTSLSNNMKRVNSVAQIGMPLNGRANFRFSKKGQLLNAKAVLDAGAGFVKFPSIMVEKLLVDEGKFQIVYDAQQNQMRIEDSVVFVSGVEARLAGVLRPIKDDNDRLMGMTYRLAANSREVEGGERPEYMVENVTLVGNVDWEKRQLNIGQFSLAAGNAKIDIAGNITDGIEGTAITLNGKMKHVPVNLVKTLWPPAALQGAREWVVENMKNGIVSEAEMKVALSPQALKQAEENQPIPQDQINIAFSYDNVTSTYFGELPAISEAKGYGLLTGNSFKLQLSSGKTKVSSGKSLDLSDGYFEISELHKHGPESTIKMRIKGGAQAMMEVIDQKPLLYASKSGIEPKSIGGSGEANILFKMPLLLDLPIERVFMDTKLTINDVKLKDVIGDIDLTGGVLNIDVSTQKLVASGNVFLNKAPAYLKWSENFDLSKKYTSHFTLKSRLTEKTRKLLGIDLSSFLGGPTPLVIEGYGRGQDIALAKVNANLEEAHMYYEPLGWSRSKEKGTSATFNLGFAGNDEITIKKLRLKGKNVHISGGLHLKDDGRILKANLDKIYLGPVTKLSVKGARDKKGVLRLVAKAKAIDGRAIIDQMNEPNHPKTLSRGKNNIVHIKAIANSAPTYNQHALRNIKGDITLNSGRLTNLLLTGSFEDRSNLNITVATNNDRRRMVLQGQNAGLILNAANLYGKVRGGTIIFKTWLSEPGKVSTGTLRMKDFIVSDKDLNKIAHNSPKVELRPKKGELFFEKIKVPFKRSRNRIKIKDAVLKGQALGATANGSIDTGANRINVAGSIIPAYGLNSFISHVPVVGQLITGGKGEGVIGINFSIRGDVKNPHFKTDPLSALAPGILRKLLQGGGGNSSFKNNNEAFQTD